MNNQACYWEVRWEGRVNVGVTYRGIKRKGDGDDCCIGRNDQSWSLICSPQGYTAWHNNTPTDGDAPPPSESSRLAVYLDGPAGTVSFCCLLSIASSIKSPCRTFEPAVLKTGPWCRKSNSLSLIFLSVCYCDTRVHILLDVLWRRLNCCCFTSSKWSRSSNKKSLLFFFFKVFPFPSVCFCNTHFDHKWQGWSSPLPSCLK